MEFSSLLRVFENEDDASTIMDELLHKRLNVVRSRLLSVMHQRLTEEQTAKLIDAFEKLSVRFRARALTSAEIYELIQMDVGEADEINPSIDGLSNQAWYDKALDCFHREQFFSDLEQGKEPTVTFDSDVVWSPLGDYFGEKKDGVWSLRTAEMIGGVVALDFDSHLAKRTELKSGVLSQTRVEPTPEEKREIAAKLAAAMQLIDDAVPVYGILVRNFTRRVMIRRSNEDGQPISRISSEHVPRQPGIVRMLNTHSKDHSVVKCAESLLHESVHNFIACWETANAYLLRTTDQYRPVSPWSGNPIPNSSLAHAIFVYYACLRLFERFHKMEASFTPENFAVVKDRSNVFVSGFLIRRRLSEQFLSTEEPPASFLSAVDRVQALISKWQKNPSLELVQCAA